MLRWFNRQMRGIQILLLILPIVNWVIEIGVRWSKFIEKPGIGYCVLAILVSIGGMAIGFLDAIWCLLFKHLIFAVSEKDL
ncbi:MAG: hypothetical protein MJ208_03190 [Bacilli bacterium]|nr:hypothetical protein [Bacilli bacterium]